MGSHEAVSGSEEARHDAKQAAAWPARILVLEDEIFVAMDLAEALEDAGFHVVGPFTATTDAEHAARRGEVDAAVLDVNLGNGHTSASVASLLRSSGVPFAFVSAYDHHEIDGWCDGDWLLQKPVVHGELIQTIRSWCR